MGSYDHLPAEQQHLAGEVDAVLGPLLRGMTGALTKRERRSDEPVPRHFRIVVATDWAAATVPFLLLQAFARIVPSEAPVDLVFAVPGTPGERDLAAAKLLRDSLSPGTRHAGIIIESFETACERHACASVVPMGDSDLLLRDVVAAVTVMHDLAELSLDLERLDAQPAPADGPNARLRRRFDSYLAVPPKA
ncbi:MAG: hypothetical protein Q4G51_13015 [Dermatophilus congolensis]|nr:hypothetical protein [Dermatophilus congolensis]